MRGLQWDLMTVPQRFRVLAAWDCAEFGYASSLVELSWQELPKDVKGLLRWMR